MIMLLLFLVEALLVGGEFSSRHLDWSGVLHSGYIALDLLFLFVSVILILGASSLILSASLRTKIFARLDLILENKNWLAGVVIISSLICYEFFQDYLFLRSDMPSILYHEYRKILLNKYPAFMLIFLGSFQILLSVIILKWNLVKSWIQTTIRWRGFIFFLILVFVFFLLNFSGYGFIHAGSGALAQTLNAPLLGIQVSLIAGCLFGAGWIYSWMIKKWPGSKPYLTAELLVVFGIWILTIALWNNSPLGSNYYIEKPRAPNYEYYPSSDQLKWDIQALDLLNGGGIRPNVLEPGGDYVAHSMHSLYLAVLHAISGEGYEDILFLQIVILSFIPVLLYKLGSIIHTRFSGLVISLLYLVRERNAIFLGEHITVSNVKTMMTEPLALLVFLIFLYLLLLWMRSDNHKPWLILLAGGVFGALVLIRIEVLAMIPVIGVMVLFHFRRQPLVWLRGVGLAGISIILMITPWVFRNYQVVGRFELDKSDYIRWIFDKYRDYFLPEVESVGNSDFLIETQFVEIPTAGKNAVSANIIPDGGQLIEIQAESPTTYFLDHFFNSVLQTVYYLPNNHQPFFTIGSRGALLAGVAGKEFQEYQFLEEYLKQYVNGLPYWRYAWDGKLVARSYLPILVTLGLISSGLFLLKKDRIWIPVLFLLLILTQSAVYAILSGSGGRFINIVDWIPLLFYGIGLSGVLSKGLLLVNGPDFNRSVEDFTVKLDPVGRSQSKWTSLLVLGGVLFAGLLLPLSELLIPSPYTEAALESQIEILRNDSSITYPLENMEGDVILFGKALFPRFFEAGDRMEDDRGGTIPDYSYTRIEFYLVGTQNTWVSLPLVDTVDYFPHGSEVLILADLEDRDFSPDGQMVHGSYYKARKIYILNADQPGNDPISLVCSGLECALDANK